MHHEKLDVIVFAIDLEINEGKKDSAKDFVSKITDNVKRTSLKLWFISIIFRTKKTKFFLLEIYPNNEAALLHMKNFTGSNWEAEFVENFSIKSASILGKANSKLKKQWNPIQQIFEVICQASIELPIS